MRRRAAAISIGIAVSALFVYLSFRHVDLNAVVREMARVSVAILSLSLLSKLAGFLTISLRSKVLFRPIRNMSFSFLFGSVILGFTANNILFMRLGDLARVDYVARRYQLSRSTCLAVVALERLLDSFVLLILFAMALPMLAVEMPASFSLLYIGTGIVGAVLIALAISHYPRAFVQFCRWISSILGEKISRFVTVKSEKFTEGLLALRSLRGVATVVMLSWLYWVTAALSIQIWLWAFHVDLPWLSSFLILGFAAFGSSLPASPGNLGTYHYFVILALTILGISESVSRSFAIVGHAMAYLPYTIAGIPLVMREIASIRRSYGILEGRE